MIRPFYIDDGIPSIPDSTLYALWEKLVVRRRPLVEEFANEREFAEAMKAYSIVVLGDLEGFVYFTHKNPSAFELHLQFFVPGERALELGRAVVGNLFDAFNTLQILYGYIPVTNERASRFCDALGCHTAARIPGKCWMHDKSVDAYLYYIRRPL